MTRRQEITIREDVVMEGEAGMTWLLALKREGGPG